MSPCILWIDEIDKGLVAMLEAMEGQVKGIGKFANGCLKKNLPYL